MYSKLKFINRWFVISNIVKNSQMMNKIFTLFWEVKYCALKSKPPTNGHGSQSVTVGSIKYKTILIITVIFKFILSIHEIFPYKSKTLMFPIIIVSIIYMYILANIGYLPCDLMTK